MEDNESKTNANEAFRLLMSIHSTSSLDFVLGCDISDSAICPIIL